jgi:hypothetical protein
MINTWNESLLHEELKDYYCGNEGSTEVPLEGSICDVLMNDGLIVEIQTANLGKLKKKLEKLLETHRVKLVYPVARNTLIETYAPGGELVSKRKSPKHETIYHLFSEMTGLWHLIGNSNLEIEIVHADILEIRIADGTGSWRRKGVRKQDRKLIRIHETERLTTKKSWRRLIPETISGTFTVKDLSKAGAGGNAGKMAWILKNAGIIELVGKEGRAFLYRTAPAKAAKPRKTT